MNLLGKVAFIALLSGVPIGGASAGDLITYPTSGGQQVPVADQNTYDWSGFYAGLYGAGQVSPKGGNQYALGIDAGVNGILDFYMLGGEASLEGLTGGGAYGKILGRAGVLVTDSALAYGAAGYGLDLGAADESDFLAGGGIEYAVTEDVSLRAQYLHAFPITGADPKDQLTLGANFHF